MFSVVGSLVRPHVAEPNCLTKQYRVCVSFANSRPDCCNLPNELRVYGTEGYMFVATRHAKEGL